MWVIWIIFAILSVVLVELLNTLNEPKKDMLTKTVISVIICVFAVLVSIWFIDPPSAGILGYREAISDKPFIFEFINSLFSESDEKISRPIYNPNKPLSPAEIALGNQLNNYHQPNASGNPFEFNEDIPRLNNIQRSVTFRRREDDSDSESESNPTNNRDWRKISRPKKEKKTILTSLTDKVYKMLSFSDDTYSMDGGYM